MIPFFSIIVILLVGARILFGSLSDAAPVFAALCAPLTVLCVVFSVILAIFIALEIMNNIRHK